MSDEVSRNGGVIGFFLGAIVIAMIVLIVPDPVPEPVACDVCEECSCALEEAQLKEMKNDCRDQIEFVQDEFDEYKGFSSTLYDDYYNCYWAFICWGNDEDCVGDGSFEQANLNWFYTKCNLAERYVEYFDLFEGEEK